MAKNEFDPFWEDKENWKWGLFYNCKADPRVIVPKRPKWMGRTLNFAHRKAYTVLLMTLIPVIAQSILLSMPGGYSTLSITVFILTIIAIIVFYYSNELRVDKD